MATDKIDAPVNEQEEANEGGGTQEHIDEMIKVADGEAPTKEEDSLLAGKYKTEDDLQKGVLELIKKQNEGATLEDIYKELESNIGKPKETKDEESEEVTESEEIQEDPFNKYAQEYLAKGELSTESIKELGERGIGRDMIDVYMKGLEVTKLGQEAILYDIAGSEEEFKQMADWAANNFTEERKESINKMFQSGDIEQQKMAMESLKTNYVAANGKPPKDMIRPSEGGTKITSNRYESRAQMIKDMSDERYQKDPAFRDAVMNKIANSQIWN